MKYIAPLRFFLVFLAIVLACSHKRFELYDKFIFCVLMAGLILNYIRKKPSLQFDAIANYFFWLALSIVIASLRTNKYLDIYSLFAIILASKVLIVGLNYLKYRHIKVTSTFVSKLWILALFCYLSELILNSTHGFRGFCFYLGLISSVESLFIIIRFKQWKPERLFFIKNNADQ